MIDQLTGTVLRHSPTEIVVDVNGIGFLIQTTLPASERFSKVGERYTIPTWLQFKEDAIALYGFGDNTERELFESLITISGIGPKTALRILSETTPEQLYQLVLRDDTVGLSKIKGVGKKTAQLLTIQLKGLFAKRGIVVDGGRSAPLAAGEREALLALTTLGVKEAVAQKAIERAQKELGSYTTAELIEKALRYS